MTRRTRCLACAPSFALAFLLALTAGCGGEDGNGTVSAGEAASFAGTPWVLAAGLDVDGWESAPPSATFADSTVGESTGPNRFTAPYSAGRRHARDRDACVDPDGLCTAADAVERAYVSALERVTGWRSDGAELVLLDGDGAELLRYTTATPVGEWNATAIQTGWRSRARYPAPRSRRRSQTTERSPARPDATRYTTHLHDRTRRDRDRPAGPRPKKACAAPDGVMEQEAAISPRFRPRFAIASTADRSRFCAPTERTSRRSRGPRSPDVERLAGV